MKEGIIHAITLRPGEGVPATRVEAALVHPQTGLKGDYFSGDDLSRSVTLIELETLNALKEEYGFDIGLEGSRRNVITEGVRLNDLVGKTFRLGSAILEGSELCHPCQTIAKYNSEPELLKALLDRGGLCARVLEGGEIKVGDSLELEPS